MIMKKKILLIVDVVLLTLLIAADQTTKYLAATKLMGCKPVEVWEGVFELHYLENKGAAFGILQGQKIFFVLVAVIILTMITYVLWKAPYQKIYTKLHVALIFIASGAVGNLVDRLRFEYVVDFLYFSLINFPVFNLADIYVTLSSIYLVFLLLFVYKESDLEFLSFRTKKFRDVK